MKTLAMLYELYRWLAAFVVTVVGLMICIYIWLMTIFATAVAVVICLPLFLAAGAEYMGRRFSERT